MMLVNLNTMSGTAGTYMYAVDDPVPTVYSCMHSAVGLWGCRRHLAV